MNTVHLRGIRLAWTVIALQMSIGIVGSLLMVASRGREEAGAALFGAVAVTLPNIYFAVRIYVRGRRGSARVLLGNVYRAEVGKLLLTGLMFYVGARLFPGQFLFLMLSSIGCLLVPWLMLLVRID